MFDELLARELSRPSYYRLHRKSVDTHCLQHPDTYCASAKSFAAHFIGLCCAFEHGGHPSVLKAIQKWLNGARSIAKPELPLSRGALTIADVFGTSDENVDSFAHAVERWTLSTWEAYAPLHPIARRWIREAFGGR